jgi:hypothetical protein
MSTRSNATPQRRRKLQTLTAEALRTDKAFRAAKEKLRAAKARLKLTKSEFKTAKGEFKAARKIARRAAKLARHAQSALQEQLERVAQRKRQASRRTVAKRLQHLPAALTAASMPSK